MQYGMRQQRVDRPTVMLLNRFSRALLLLSGLSMITTSGHAETLGLTDGHAFDHQQFKELTLDLAGRAQTDAQRGGLKITLPQRLNGLAFYLEGWGSQGQLGDLSVTSEVDFSGQGQGFGLYLMQLPNWKSARTTIRLAYNREDNNVDSLIAVAGRQATVDHELRNLTARLILSPLEAFHASGLTGYLAIGVVKHRMRRHVFVDQRLEPALSRQDSTVQGYLAAGIVYPAQRFRLYAVAEYQQAYSLSIGIRWHVSKTP